MTCVFFTLLFVTNALISAPEPQAPAGDFNARIEYTLKNPRKNDPVLGGPKDKVFVSAWIPEGLKVVRGGICNPFSKGDDVSKHWQAACRYWKFAYVQVDFDGVKDEEYALLNTGLAELAKKAGRPELEHLPLCFIGMSRGGGISMKLAEMMPERTIAVAPVCLEVGPGSEATRRIPVITIFGEKDGSQMAKLQTKLSLERQLQARFGIAVQWNRKHEFALANNLSFVHFDEAISRRLPKIPISNKPTPLADIPLEEGWLGDISTWGKDGKMPMIAAWREFKGDRNLACWFSSQRVASVWQGFVGASRDVTIIEPPGLGDKQPFILYSAGKKMTVKISINNEIKPTRIILRDEAKLIAEKTEGPWVFEISLKPGIHSLIATVDAGGQKASRPHTIVVGD